MRAGDLATHGIGDALRARAAGASIVREAATAPVRTVPTAPARTEAARVEVGVDYARLARLRARIQRRRATHAAVTAVRRRLEAALRAERDREELAELASMIAQAEVAFRDAQRAAGMIAALESAVLDQHDEDVASS
jgi:hypothetical protein